MKQYQSWLGQYLMSRRDGDHAMASELANSICEFWQTQGDEAESHWGFRHWAGANWCGPIAAPGLGCFARRAPC